MNRNKIIITVALITGLMLLSSLLAAGIVLTFGIDVKYNLGILSPLAFVFAALIFGRSLSSVINIIKSFWGE